MFFKSSTKPKNTSYYKEQEPNRAAFTETVECLHGSVKFNIRARAVTLAEKDIALLRAADAALTYLLSQYAKNWKVCLPNLVLKYIDNMQDLLNETRTNSTTSMTVTEDFLSIVDVAIIVDQTDDILHYLITEFDPGAYYQRRSMFSRFTMFMNSARTVTDSRRQIAAPSAVSDTQ